MKILLFNDEFYTTGASIALLRLAEHLRQEHEVVVMPRVNGEGDIKTKLQALDIPIVSTVAGVDLIIANTIMGGDFIAKFGASCPCIWWMHESDIGPRLILRMPQLAEGFRHAAAVVFQTNYQKTVYTSFTSDSPAQFHVLPFWNNGVYSQDIEPASKEKLRIVSIGTIEPRKRVQDTINAIELLGDDLKRDVEFVFIGKYLQLADREAQIVNANPERYRFLGEQPNEATLSYLASADCFVLPSSSESQPLTIWESFELEIPVCISDLDTYRSIGLKHGVNALTHPVGNVDMLAENIRIVLTNRSIRTSLTRAGKSLLLRMLAKDWRSGFDSIIQEVATRDEIRKLGY
ncbi:glycosyltransferase family 4 protein [Massilia sp. Dwa41.01b]|uniref:glycosyltransferase family 4 protein n=1 Tax=unclassified Massilia TaxID=2609279 RepID=UPI0015FFE213|nr:MULTISPECIES: glycosyltransferase family 4 protein [unclassified Massilia]QNA88230.1 glycosyltransferase family 4 protein [Massilia sp. Dwa41.01b]QNA99129.1 glycosyltransferase family 4 protein [Massilia sp. Se16.2.3]